ncbi:MAG: DUF1036 domain-containing protein [Xanthobacteraceae bacterium]|nr:DUF1036 domain-containing protein [Xanthobacteraceae bacterium]
MLRSSTSLALLALLTCASAAHADFKVCNRMSYVVEAAVGVADKNATVTRGWFRIDPATCRTIAQGTLNADRILLNARALPIYGASPLPQNGSDKLCVGQGNFLIASARQCTPEQTLAGFTEVKPSTDDDGNTVAYLSESSEYDDEQSRLAGVQRLLTLAGYDASPIDGVDGPKTQAALAAFLKANNLNADTAIAPNFFETMIAAVQSPNGPGLTWCNDTSYRVMAAVGTDDGKSVTTRGWFRVDTGKCVHPDMSGQPRRVFSFAEAVADDGRAIKKNGTPVSWGGSHTFCTRDTQFETSDQNDCGGRGFNANGFALVDMSANKTLRFAQP